VRGAISDGRPYRDLKIPEKGEEEAQSSDNARHQVNRASYSPRACSFFASFVKSCTILSALRRFSSSTE